MPGSKEAGYDQIMPLLTAKQNTRARSKILVARIAIDNGPLTDVPIQDALIHLRSDTSSDCVPTFSAPCLYTVELLKLNLGPTSFQGVGIPLVEFRNSASISLQVVPGEAGPVAILPSSLEVQSTGISEMGVVTGTVAVQTDLIMVVDPTFGTSDWLP